MRSPAVLLLSLITLLAWCPAWPGTTNAGPPDSKADAKKGSRASARPSTTSTTTSTSTTPVPTGREVASIGPEILRLPEVTAAVKARLAEVPDDQSLDRRQVVAVSKGMLKAMIVRSLVFQEAREVLGGPEPLAALVKGLERRWSDKELPALIRREGSGSEAGLRARLAKRSTTPGLLREEFLIRSVAEELMRRDASASSTAVDLAGYLDNLRRRRPITLIMTEAELNAAGRDAAIEGKARR